MVRLCTRLAAGVDFQHIGDHIFGLLPLMASIANGAGGTAEDIEDPRAQSNVDVEVGLSKLPQLSSSHDS